jgi:hypothetical protein
LLCILRENAILALQAGDEAAAASRQDHLSTCQENLDIALANLGALMPARKENIEALLMGVHYAIESSKTAVA